MANAIIKKNNNNLNLMFLLIQKEKNKYYLKKMAFYFSILEKGVVIMGMLNSAHFCYLLYKDIHERPHLNIIFNKLNILVHVLLIGTAVNMLQMNKIEKS